MKQQLNNLLLKIAPHLQRELTRVFLVSFLVSVVSSTATYFLVKSQIPKFATIDLLYLTNDFSVNLAKYKLDHGASDDEVAKIINQYSKNLNPLLQDISRRGNYVLFQKQALVTDAPDITNQIKQIVVTANKINQDPDL